MIRPLGPTPTPAPRPSAAAPGVAPEKEATPLDSVHVQESKPWIVFPGWKVLLLQTLAFTSMLSPVHTVAAAEALRDDEKITQTFEPHRPKAETIVQAESRKPEATVQAETPQADPPIQTEAPKPAPQTAIRETLDTARELWDGIADRHSFFQHESEVGDYTLKIDAGTTDLDLLHRVRANVGDRSASVDLGLKLDVHAFRAELSDSEPQGDWTFRHGLRADVAGHYTAAHRIAGQVDGTAGEDISTHSASATTEAFAGWTREVAGGGKLSVDTSAGVSSNLEAGSLTPYLQSSQVLRYDLSGRIPLMGDDVDGVVKLREGVAWDSQAGELQPGYEAFAGIGKKLDVKGHTIKIEVGGRVRGDRHDPFDAGPKVKFGFRW